MPLHDYHCDSCGWTFEDIYRHRSELKKPIQCADLMMKISHLQLDDEGFPMIDDDGEEIWYVTDESGCDSEDSLQRMIGAPAAMKRVKRVGKHGSKESRREEAVEKSKRLVKRSKDHEFKKGGKGVEARRERLEQLKKARVPIAGIKGF